MMAKDYGNHYEGAWLYGRWHGPWLKQFWV